MKRIKLLASGALIISLIAIAVGASFLMASTTATRPSKTYNDYMTDGDLYLENGEYFKAIVSYENALTERTDSIDALQGLASTYYRQMNREKETEVRNQIAEKDPSNLDNQVRLVELMINVSELDQTYRYIQNAMMNNYRITYTVNDTDESRFITINEKSSFVEARRDYSTVEDDEYLNVYSGGLQEASYYKQTGGTDLGR